MVVVDGAHHRWDPSRLGKRSPYFQVYADMRDSHVTPLHEKAVSPQPLGPWCDQCAEGACSQCKITKGRDWTYTIYQGLGP